MSTTSQSSQEKILLSIFKKIGNGQRLVSN